ncbi:MAG: prevent-host-death protein [Pseudomonadota bacterium]
MNTVSKSKLKAHMLEYFRRVESTGEELIITDNRKPVLKVIVIQNGGSVDDVFRKYRSKTKIGSDADILEPAGDNWELEE